jgi:transporter family protein
VIAGLIPMLGWGIADFLQSNAVRKLSTAQVLFVSNIFWTLIILPFAFFVDLGISMNNLILVIIGSLFQLVAMVKLYEAMKIGEVSIVTPISASYPIITVILLIVLLGNALSPLTLAAIIVMTVGIALASTDLKRLKHIHTTKGVKEAVVSLFFFGIYFFILELLSRDITFLLEFKTMGSYTFFFYTSIFNGLALLIYGMVKKERLVKKEVMEAMPYMFTAEIIYLVSWLALTYGFIFGESAVVTAISSVYPAVTIILALIFYKEKLVMNQYFGILMILAGLIMISL